MGNMGDHNYSISQCSPIIHKETESLIIPQNPGDEAGIDEPPPASPRIPRSPKTKSTKPKRRKKDIYTTVSIFQRSRKRKRLSTPKSPKPPKKPARPSHFTFSLFQEELEAINETAEPKPMELEGESPPLIFNSSCRHYTNKTKTSRRRSSIHLPKSDPFPMCPMCREIFTLLDYHILLQRSRSLQSSCPFACSSTFPSPEALKLHITNVHLHCECSGKTLKIPEEEATSDFMIPDPSPTDSILACPCGEDSNDLNSHLVSHEFSPVTEFSPEKPDYLINLSLNVLTASQLSKSKTPSRNSTVNCMTCAIKFKTVKDYLSHMRRYHKDSIPLVMKPKQIPKVEEVDEEPDPFGIWTLDESRNPIKVNGADDPEDFDIAVKEYLEELDREERELRHGMDNNDFVFLEKLEENSINDELSVSSKEHSSASSSKLDPIKSINDLSEEKMEEPKKSVNPVTPTIRCHPKIIEVSQTFDPLMKEYLLKLRRDHKSLTRALSSMKSAKLGRKSLEKPPSEIFDFDEETFQAKRECPKCGEMFHSTEELARHFYFIQELKEEGKKSAISWRCAQCDKSFRTLQILICHRYFIHDDESMVHICNNCCKILTSTSMVNSHECTTTTFSCRECCKQFRRAKDLLRHNRQNHWEQPGPHHCPICRKKFLTMSMMKRHKQKCEIKVEGADNEEDEDNEAKTLHQCSVCHVFWKTTKELLAHVKEIHSVELCRICNICYPIGNFISHVINSDLKNRPKVKFIGGENHDVFATFIKAIGEEHLMSLVRYVSYDSIKEKVICQICGDNFNTELHYRIHNVKYHDLYCVLCNQRFEEANDAYIHKKMCHSSIYRYIWFAEEVMRVLVDSDAFKKMKQGFINNEVIFDSLEKQLLNIEKFNLVGMEFHRFIDGNFTVLREKELKNGEGREDNQIFIIITDDDMVKYKDNVSQFAEKIGESCDLFPIEEIEKMLRHSVFNR